MKLADFTPAAERTANQQVDWTMPKSKSRKKRGSSSSSAKLNFGGPRPSAAKRRRNSLILAAAAIIAVGAAGTYWWLSIGEARDFAALAAAGAPALAGVESEISRGQTHLAPGETVNYPDRFPVSGPHHRVPVRPGFYDELQMPTRLVHSVEHGYVAIYYDQPGEPALEHLRSWAARYTGNWDGVVVTPMPGLGEGIVLTAWTKRLALERFDAASAAAFIDAYRGRGPENPVR